MAHEPSFTDAIHEHENGVIVSIRVVPGARTTEFAGVNGGALRLRIAAAPVDGKANRAVLEFLAEMLGVRPRQLTLLRGEKDRNKQIFVSDMSVDQVAEALAKT